MTKWLGWLMLGLTVAVGLWRGAAPPATSLQLAPTRMVWYEGSFPKGGAVGVIPTRGGRKGEGWTLADVVVTGSRSPLPPDVPRLARPERVTVMPRPVPQERLLVIEVTKRPLARVLLLGKDVPEGLLTSPSTRFTPGLLAATDLATLVAGELRGVGRPSVVVPGNPQRLQQQQQGWEAKAALLPLMPILPWLLAGALVLGIRWPVFSRGAVAFPLALLLVPCVLSGWGAVLVSVILAVLMASKFPSKTIALVLVVLLWADVVLGGPLLDRSPFSYSVTEAARFYGIGNEAAGLLIGAALAAPLDIPALLAVALALGFPTLGANNGCFLAGLVGVVLRLPRGRWWGALMALLLVGGMARWDALRGAEVRTHLGQAVSGEKAGIGALVQRKLVMNLHLLVSSPWMLVLLVGGTHAWRRRDLVGGGSALAALLLNDSGVVAAATLLLVDKKSPLAPEPEGVVVKRPTTSDDQT